MRSTPPAACRRHQCTFRLIPTASTKPFGVTIATAAEFPAEPKRDNRRRSVELRPHCWTPIELAAGIHLCGSFPNEGTAGDTGDIRLRLSPCNLRRRPWETSRGFPPLGGNPCRPSLGALGRPRSLWAASDPQADPERLPHELPSAPREPRGASGPGVEAMADDVWAWC